MKNKICKILLTLVFIFVCYLITSFGAIYAVQVIPADVSEPSSDCVFLGIKGKYIAEAQKALDRINEIRYEACKEGVKNPSTGKALKTSDYVPIKWSSDLEYIARIRAAESSLTIAHERTNSKSVWGVKSPNNIQSTGEVIAWNWSENMTSGINQWYSEKKDWVKNTPGAVTGHYTQMIDPTNLYVGLGTFCTNIARYYNTTVGQFSGESNLDETKGTGINDCIQTIEVNKSKLNNKYEIVGKNNLKINETEELSLTTSIKLNNSSFSGLNVLDNINWTSDDTKIVSIDTNAKVTAKKCGTTKVTATYGGKEYKYEIKVAHKYDSEWTVDKPATTTSNGSKSHHCTICGEKSDITTIRKISKIALSKTSYTYDAKTHKPSVTVKDGKGKKISASNYTVSYAKGRKNVGKYSVKIKFKNNYSGSKTLKFTINPKNTKINKVIAKSKGFKIKTKKYTKQTTGYEIQYSTDKKFKKGNKIIKINNKTTSKTISKLKGKKKYYIRIRTYKTLGGKTYYSSWSKYKTVITKK